MRIPMPSYALLLSGIFSLFLLSCTQEANETAPTESNRVIPEAISVNPKEGTTIQGDTDPASKAAPMDYTGMPLNVLDISERSYDGGGALSVTLSVPLDPAINHDDYFHVTQDGNLIDGGWVLSESGKIAYFSHAKPNTKYRVKVVKGLEAINGETLNATEENTITTRHIEPSVSFSGNGHFLPLGLHSGLPVTAVNIPHVDVEFHRVKSASIHRFLDEMAYNTHSRYFYSMQQLEPYIELAYTARYDLELPANKRRTLNLPVQHIDALNAPGVYLAVMKQAGKYAENFQTAWFSVTDIGLHIRVYDEQYHVHLSSIETAKPMDDVSLSVLTYEGKVSDSSKSTPEGFASVRKSNKDRYLIARKDQSVSVVSLTGAALDLSDFDLGNRPQRTNELFMYGPRDLYRPGETVQVSALLRSGDGAAVKGVPLQATLTKPDGQTAKTFSWKPKQNAYYSFAFELAADAVAGQWELEVKNVDQGETRYTFKVEEFLPERMKIQFNPGNTTPQRASADEVIKVDVLGEYLYGAPAAGNRFESVITTRLKRDAVVALPGFKFGNVNEPYATNHFPLNDVQLDNAGKATISIRSQWEDVGSPLAVTLRGSLFESGGRPVTRRHETVIWPKAAMIGIRPSFGDKNPEANTQVSFELVMATPDGEKLAANDIEVRLVREDRRYFWVYNQHQGWHYEHTEREYDEFAKSIRIDKGQTAHVSAAVEWGAYRLEVRDPKEGTVSSIRFNAGENWYYDWQNNQEAGQASRPDKVTLALDKASYEPGDVATLSIVPPTAGEAIVLVESDEALFMSRVSVPKAGTTVEIPVKKSWNRHDLYISVVHIQGAQDRNQANHFIPKRAFGLVHLPLNRAHRQFDVEIVASDKITPNQTYMTKVKVSGAKNMSNVQLTLAAVDVGVLSITDFETPDPHGYFFEPRRYQVDSRDMYQKLIELNDNALARQRFGGDAELSRGGKKAQSEVQIVSMFSGLVSVNNEGEATIPLTIPDFNGRLRLMAVAFNDDSYGSADTEVTVAAPLVTQLSMPRFLAMGDQSMFAVDVHNLTDDEQTLAINLDVTPPVRLDTAGEHTTTLAQGEKVTLTYPVTTDYSPGRSEIALRIDGISDYTVSRQWAINVRPAHPALTHSKKAILKPNEEFELTQTDFEGMIPSSVEAVVRINNAVDLNVRDQMDQLLRYPYGCLEQSISSTYPWLFASDENLQQMDLKNQTGRSRSQSIETGMSRVASRLRDNGSYGAWSSSDNENFWLTAYAGDFLTDARQQGVSVDKVLYEKTLSRLQDYVSRRNGEFGYPWSDHSGNYGFTYRAYAAYVLSRHNQARLSHLRHLAKHDVNHAKSPLPLLHLALALHNQGDPKAAATVFENAFSKTREQGYFGDYGSEVRDSAMAIHLLLRHQLHMDKAKEMGVALADALADKRYLSTQERNSLFLAGLAMETRFSDRWTADLALKQAVETLKAKGSFARKYDYTDLGEGISVKNTGEGDLYVDVDYQGYTKTPPPIETTNSLGIRRDYYDTNGQPLDPGQLHVGDLVLVKLTLDTPWRAPDMLVVDLLPAGLELENQNLSHAIKLDELMFEGKSVADWRGRTQIVHQEFRDDRFVAAVDAGYYGNNHLFYLARAVTPGTYSVPAPFMEDMYRPENRAVGMTLSSMTIHNAK